MSEIETSKAYIKCITRFTWTAVISVSVLTVIGATAMILDMSKCTN